MKAGLDRVASILNFMSQENQAPPDQYQPNSDAWWWEHHDAGEPKVLQLYTN